MGKFIRKMTKLIWVIQIQNPYVDVTLVSSGLKKEKSCTYTTGPTKHKHRRHKH